MNHVVLPRAVSCKHPCPAHFVRTPCQTHPSQVLQSLLTSCWVESGVSDKGYIQTVQGWGACKTGLKTTGPEGCIKAISFGVKTIMVAKPKCSKLSTSKGPPEWRISKGTTNGHFGPPWSFEQILSMMTAPPCGQDIMTQKGTSRNSCLVPYTLQPFKALTPEGKPFEGIRA